MTRMFRKRSRAEQGQSVAELALLLPLLVLLAVGVGDMGRAFHTYIVITNASREGARYASHFPWLASRIRDVTIDEAANSGVDLTAVGVVISIDPNPPETNPPPDPSDPGVAQPGNTITVGVEFPFHTILGGAEGLPELNLRTQTTMVVFGKN